MSTPNTTADIELPSAPTPEPPGGNALRRLVFKLARTLGLDRAIAYTVLARGWAATAGIVTVALIARSLSPVEQGYYYTFGSLVAMQLIFELGFSVVILQMATHEAAHLDLGGALVSGSVFGDAVAHARLASILRKTIRWYTIAAGLMAVVLLASGFYFFGRNTDPAHAVAWHLPWILVVLAASVTFQIDPIFSFMEGCGMVARVARIRFLQAALGSLLAWTALITHHGLFAPAALIAGQAIVGVGWIVRLRPLLLGLVRHDVGPHQIDWWQEVWPFQWRIAISYASGFFIYQLFNPILFAYRGAAEAGRMGMSINISNAVASVAIAWINTKAAPFGAMIARRQYQQLDRMFFRALWQSFGLSVCGSLFIWTGSLLLAAHHFPFAQRLLGPVAFAMLLLAMNVNQIVSSMALYLRAHKQEKFLLNSVAGAVTIGTGALLLGPRFGAAGMASVQLAASIVIGLFWGGSTFFKYRRMWHAE